MKNEYDMIVLMHSTLNQLDDSIEPDDSIYSVDGFDGQKLQKANSIVTPQSSFSNKKPRQKSAINSESKNKRSNVSAVKEQTPIVAKST